jgi:cell wall-associated NlpC family hydrolase
MSKQTESKHASRGRRLAAWAAGTAAVLAAVLVPLSAQAATAPLGQRVYAQAQTRAGDWYAWGGSGPSVFDCSGLVYWAARQQGVSNMPRTTYGMLAAGVYEGILRPTRYPVAGDLAFYGTGHVEFVARGHDVTFGALHTGAPVAYHFWGYPGSYWRPTMYFHWTGRL